MAGYTLDNGHGTTYEFEIVEKIPKNYLVWNIGNNMGRADLIPLAIVDANYNVDRGSLKAIKVNADDAEFIRHITGKGVSSLQRAKARKARLEKKRVPLCDWEMALLAELRDAVRIYSELSE